METTQEQKQTTTLKEYIARYGKIVIEDSEYNYKFYCDGLNQIGGKLKAGQFKNRGMF